MRILNTAPQHDHTKEPLFFGRPTSIARYDTQRYPFIEKQTRKQIGFFWVPEEISLTHDKREFNDVLDDAARHMFTSNLKYQIVLDTVQGRAPNLAFLPIVSCPSMETWIETWGFFETIHSRSYTHIIRGLYNNPSEVLDHVLDVPEIVKRAEQSTAEYDAFLEMMNVYRLFGEGEIEVENKTTGVTKNYNISEREVKRQFLKTAMSVYILEGVRFYVSFACSWAFAETMKVLTKNAKIIKMIARDENLHMATLHQYFKHIAAGEEGAEMKELYNELLPDFVEMFREAGVQEKEWAKYLFKDGSIIGLNAQILGDYVEYIIDRRMKALGLKSLYGRSANPLPWTDHWIGSREAAPPPQEVELTTYVVGGLDTSFEAGDFDDLI